MTQATVRSRYGLRRKIAPGIELYEIIVKLDEFGPPVVEMHGRLATGKRTVDRASRALIQTSALGPAGVNFIEELKRDFGGYATASADEQRDDQHNVE